MRVFRNIALCIIELIMHNAISIAQVNLVSNPSFEMIYSCPSDAGQLDSAIGWSTLKNGGGGNPELFNSCCTNPFICGVPLNYHNLSFQYPHSGNSYVGIDAINSMVPNGDREYIQSKLNKGLSSVHNYCVKFYSSLSDQNLAYITTLGAYLDSGNVIAYGYCAFAYANSLLQPVIPQIYNTSQS